MGPITTQIVIVLSLSFSVCWQTPAEELKSALVIPATGGISRTTQIHKDKPI